MAAGGVVIDRGIKFAVGYPLLELLTLLPGDPVHAAEVQALQLGQAVEGRNVLQVVNTGDVQVLEIGKAGKRL